MTAVDASLGRRRRRKMEPTPPPDRTTQYALDVVAGRVVAGKLVRLACERHLADLATGHERGLVWDPDEAERSIGFFALWTHHEGDWGRRTPEFPRGRPILLEGWQQFVVGCAFGWRREDGRRRFRLVYLEVGSKNGKTTMCSVVGLRLAFFDGEPAAQVYSAATKRDQAKFTWSGGHKMLKRQPSLRGRFHVAGITISDEATDSYWRPLGRDSDESDQGINVHGALIDELHVHRDREVIDNIEKAAASRSQPMVWKITTAGVRGAWVWEEERSDAVAVLEGRATDDSLFAAIYTIDDEDDPFDEAVWPKANPNLGVTIDVEFLREAAAEAKRKPGKLAPFLRYHMNRGTDVSTRALSLEDWDRSASPPAIPDGAAVYLGLDLASVRDLTALLAVYRDPDGAHHVECRFWCPEEGVLERSRRDGVPYDRWVREGYLVATPGNVTDYEFVRAEALAMADRWSVKEIAYDRWNATQLATELSQAGAEVVAVTQTHAGLGPGWREVERLVASGQLRHGGHPILRWMAGNVEVETDSAGNQKPSKARSSERIDGMIALTMCESRWITYQETPTVKPWVALGR